MILVVEDNQVVSNGIKQVIQSIDESAEIAVTGYASRALQYAMAMNVTLFILDIQLKDYSGIELAKEIRDIERYLLTPILFITSNSSKELEAFRTAQCYKFITKPFSPGQVKSVLKPLMSSQRTVEQQIQKLVFKQRGYVLSVNQNDIYYLEACNRKIKVVTRQETFEVSGYTLSGLKEQLGHEFVQCHKAFLINTKWILKIDRAHGSIELLGNANKVPLGDKFRDIMQGVGK